MIERLVVLAIAAILGACEHGQSTAGPAPPACTPQADGAAVPTAAFRDFLATRPTAAEVRARYPQMILIMPRDIATRELRSDCSRFFAELDWEGRVVGGRFG